MMDITVITANLGHLKAYRVVKTPNRGLKLDLINDLQFPDARGPYPEQVTDVSGRFGVSHHSGTLMVTSTYEALTLENENHRRLTHLVADSIRDTLHEEGADAWYFSARPEIFYSILNLLPLALRDRLARQAHADLTKTPAGEILPFFELP